MHIKRYTALALIFIILVGLFIHLEVTDEIRTINFFGTELIAMPIALWVVAPIVVFYIASVMHMSYYALIKHFKLRKYQKDFDTMTDALCDAYLGKEHRSNQYTTSAYRKLGKLVDQSVIVPMDTLDEIGNEKVDTVINLIHEVKNGNVVELKKLQLDKDNVVAVQNQKNLLERGKLTPEDILAKSDRYSEEVCRDAYVRLVATAPLYAIEKYKMFMDKQALLMIFSRINADENILEVGNETLLDLINTVELGEDDFLHLSAALSTHAVPDQRIKLFETLGSQEEAAMPAYIYTLFDLEMLAPVDEILQNSQPDEYQNFKAYRALKECNKHFSIDLFVPALKQF